ncbi:MAG: phosphatidate cytidylyltransferase [Hyphomicrobiaceae bacterium]|jgi:phosphatidate cytidylyltransferase
MSDEDQNAQSASPPTATTPVISRELQLRLVSGAVVAAVALLALWAGPIPFAFLVFAVAAAMSWEWGRIVRKDGFDVPGVLHIAIVGAAAVLSGLGMAGLAVAAVAGGAIVVSALLFGGGQAKLSSLGVLYTGLPVVALVWLRSDASLGLLAVLFILIAVATTDVAAYATGRTIGGPKLAPRISPGKTWSGLAGGVFAAAISGCLLGLLTQRGNPGWMAFLAFVLALVSQGGDLAESALKRSYGLKDASDLIPGHGGFMDRMDGLVAAATLAALIALMIDAYAPARALLHGS